MKILRYTLVVGIISVFFFPSGCNKKDKWKAVPLKINKRESFNYSEMISGDLDSIAKSELEAVKKNTTEKIKKKNQKINNSLPSKSKGNSIWQGIKNTYNWFLDLF